MSAAGLPPFPAGARAVLERGIAKLGLELDERARTSLEDHARLLLAWTAHINLTSIRDPERVARDHLLDSLSAATLLRADGVTSFLDIGSGGGFPGLPLAIALPAVRAVLVESIAKKARFLRVVVDALGLASRVAVVNARAEGLRTGNGSGIPVDAVCVRAVAELAMLARLAAPLLVEGGWLVAWKRGDVGAEIAEAVADLRAAGFSTPEVHLVEIEGLETHCLVVATLVRPRRTPAGRDGRRC